MQENRLLLYDTSKLCQENLKKFNQYSVKL